MLRRRKLLGAGLLLLGAGAGLALALYYRGAPAAAPPAGPTEPLFSIERPTVKHTEGDHLAWQLRLKQLQLQHGAGQLTAEGLEEALIYGASGEPLVRVTAQKVAGNVSGRDFQVTGSVNVVSYQGVVISADTVQWDQAQGKIVCPGQVTARSREAIFSTSGVTYDLNRAQVQAPGQVNLYSGQNKILGKQLTYDLNTGSFAMQSVQMVFRAEEAQRLLQGLGRP